ncbi:MAG: 50S ribosomal protein L4 [Candidatus Pacebacteria bacterium]|nr:50S ribosomal protein L4 [Candidatus Paceibacterota bacterium]MBP9852167.1 50S ribosomal protein L4 [Candidatus Paceibacterota bacterium]
MEAKIYNIKGETAGKITLPESVFAAKVSKDAIHSTMVALQGNQRAGTAHAKGRGDVRGGGKKPWRQKGTGRARHGSSRSPIWVGGGSTHGPNKEKNYTRKINKKTLTSVLYGVLSAKNKDGEIVFVDSMSFGAFSTKAAKAALVSIAKVTDSPRMANGHKPYCLVLLGNSDPKTVKSLSNLPSVEVEQWKNVNPLMLASYKYVLISEPQEAINFFEGKKAKARKSE